jgi:nitronate monooxygenase
LQAWALEHNPDQLDAVLGADASLVSVSYGPYAQYLSRLHASGQRVATTVGNLREALAAQRAGVDIIVVRGAEGGGHGRDDVATLPLLQSVLDSVTTPVLAAGGVGTSRALAAVLAAGPAGAWVGTAFLACTEASTSPAATDDSLLSAEQSQEIRQLAESAGITLIVGPAGTGKTAALAAAHKAWQAAGVDIQGTALAAVTARRLADATGITS